MAMTARAVPRSSSDERERPARPPEPLRPAPRRAAGGWVGPRSAAPSASSRTADNAGITTRVIGARGVGANWWGRLGDGIGTRTVVIGLAGLLLVALAGWLIVSGVGMLLVGTVLVVMVAYLAAASSRTSRPEPFSAARARQRLLAMEPGDEPLPNEGPWSWGAADRWAVERANLQRQIAILEQQNAILAERLRRMETEILTARGCAR